MSSQEDDDDPSTLSAGHHQQQQQQHQHGILSPLSLESADYYEELGGGGEANRHHLEAGNNSSSSTSSRGLPTPLAYRAPWATPPKAAFEKLSVASPPLPPFTVTTASAASATAAQQQQGPPPARNASATVATVDSICASVGDALLRHQQQQHTCGKRHPLSSFPGSSARSPESDFELHDLGESFPSTPTPVKWDTAR